EEAVDNPVALAVHDRDAGAAQRLGITLAVIMEDVALRGDEYGRRDAGKARRLDRRRAPILGVGEGAQIVLLEPHHRGAGEEAIAGTGPVALGQYSRTRIGPAGPGIARSSMRATGNGSALRLCEVASIWARASAGLIASIGRSASFSIASSALTICGCRVGME